MLFATLVYHNCDTFPQTWCLAIRIYNYVGQDAFVSSMRTPRKWHQTLFWTLDNLAKLETGVVCVIWNYS